MQNASLQSTMKREYIEGKIGIPVTTIFEENQSQKKN